MWFPAHRKVLKERVHADHAREFSRLFLVLVLIEGGDGSCLRALHEPVGHLFQRVSKVINIVVVDITHQCKRYVTILSLRRRFEPRIKS